MNIFSKFFTNLGLLASVLIAGGSSVKADTVPAAAAGDLFIGFRASAGSGSSTSYIVKLGVDTTFRNAAAGSSFDVSGLGSIALDLQSTYGADWNTRADLHWGIFGARQGVNSTAYGSRARTVSGTIATAWPVLTSTARTNVAGAVTDVTSGLGGYTGSERTANSAVATFQENSGADSSYNRQVATEGTTDFGSLSQWTSIEASFGNGVSGAVLDLFRLGGTSTAGTSTHIGSFSINAAGVVRFTAVPLVTNVDTDGDGFTDSQEILAGTNPNDPKDFFRATVSSTASGARIQSPTGANKTYTVEYSETLSGGWITIATHNSGAGASPVDFTDTDPVRKARSKGFYRIKISS